MVATLKGRAPGVEHLRVRLLTAMVASASFGTTSRPFGASGFAGHSDSSGFDVDMYDTGKQRFSAASHTSHLPDDCGPFSSFGKQSSSLTKNQPSFMFSRTSRSDRARSHNFDDAHVADSLMAMEADGRRKDSKPSPGAYEPEAMWNTMGTRVTSGMGGSLRRSSRESQSSLVQPSQSQYPKRHAHGFGKSMGRESGVVGQTGASFSSDSTGFGEDVPRFSSGDVSSFGDHVARKRVITDVNYGTMLSRTRRDATDRKLHQGGALEECARGQDAPACTKTAVVVSSIGPQKLSTKKNAIGYSWGRSARDSRVLEKVSLEDTLRGPGMYHLVRDFRDTLREHRKARKTEVGKLLGLGGGRERERLPSLTGTRHNSSAPATPRTAGVKYWSGETRREPRFYPTTSREVRDAYVKEGNVASRYADGAKRRLWE